jgi:hypothetical protein
VSESEYRPLEGQVAAIIDDTTLVLNIGYRDGVKPDMVFTIFSRGQEIVDPQSGEALGQWEVVKAEVVVSHVQERLATVRPPLGQEIERTGTLSSQMVQDSFGKSGGRRKLEVKAADVSGRPQAQPIVIGDQARLKVEVVPESPS